MMRHERFNGEDELVLGREEEEKFYNEEEANDLHGE